MSAPMPVNMPKYTLAGWRRLCAVAEFQGDMPSFKEQENKATQMARAFEARGVPVEWVAADVYYVNELVSWCRREGHRLDSLGRSLFVAYWRAMEGDQ
jgi:hypothetical protein